MKVLCVDDDPSFLRSLVDSLRDEGFDVDFANSHNSALEAFIGNRFLYDVVVTDLELTGGGGERLARNLINLRQRRGYDPAPEIICLTGAASMKDPDLKNRLLKRQCQYVIKGSDQVFIETRAAVKRLTDERAKGPEVLFIHQPARKYEWDDQKTWDCASGEDVVSVSLLHSGKDEKVELGPAPRRLLDFLARRAWRRSLSVAEVANSMSLSPFYNFWIRNEDKAISKAWVKNNVAVIRKALNSTFRSLALPLTADSVLLKTERVDHSEPNVEGTGRPLGNKHFRVSDIDWASEEAESYGYRFVARPIVEHWR